MTFDPPEFVRPNGAQPPVVAKYNRRPAKKACERIGLEHSKSNIDPIENPQDIH